MWDTVPFCEIYQDDVKTYLLEENDILFARTGGTVGKSFLVKEVPYEAVYAGYLIRTRFNYKKLVPEYLKLFMESQLYWKQLRNGTIATAQPNCNGQTLSKMIVPIPPLEEQKRIVAKIEEILPYIGRYDKAYTKLETFNKKFPEDMKKSILQLALQGKLVEQRTEEGTADELYKQIVAEKARLIKDGKIKKEKPLPEITEDEIPFEIPSSWKWVRLGDVGLLQTGTTPSKSHPEYFGSDIDFLSPGDISNGVIYYGNQGLTEIGKEYARVVAAYSVIQVCIGGSIGKAAINDRQVTFNQQMNSITPYLINHKFLYYSMICESFVKQLKTNSTGTATPIINKTAWGNLIIPLPPLAEQKRVVAKIEELLSYCDQLVK